MAECPETIEGLEELVSHVQLCGKTLFSQAEARIQTGAACSVSEASRQIGEETGKNPESIRTSIRRADITGTLSQLSNTQKHRPNNGKADNSQFRTSFTGDNEWYTPLEYIQAAKQVMGSIDIDPASSDFGQSRINAGVYYTKEDDGLTKEWNGKLWLNPPYAQPLIAQFIEKAVAEFEAGRITDAIILTHNYTDTKWFHHAESVCAAICFTKGRIPYESEDGTKAQPTQGAAFFYFGDHVNRFNEVFAQYGFIR